MPIGSPESNEAKLFMMEMQRLNKTINESPQLIKSLRKAKHPPQLPEGELSRMIMKNKKQIYRMNRRNGHIGMQQGKNSIFEELKQFWPTPISSNQVR